MMNGMARPLNRLILFVPNFTYVIGLTSTSERRMLVPKNRGASLPGWGKHKGGFVLIDLLKEGFQVMLLGMSLVFFLLSLIVAVVKAMSLIVSRYEEQPLPELGRREPTFDKSGNDSEVKAVISASIHAHRTGVGKE